MKANRSAKAMQKLESLALPAPTDKPREEERDEDADEDALAFSINEFREMFLDTREKILIDRSEARTTFNEIKEQVLNSLNVDVSNETRLLLAQLLTVVSIMDDKLVKMIDILATHVKPRRKSVTIKDSRKQNLLVMGDRREMIRMVEEAMATANEARESLKEFDEDAQPDDVRKVIDKLQPTIDGLTMSIPEGAIDSGIARLVDTVGEEEENQLEIGEEDGSDETV